MNENSKWCQKGLKVHDIALSRAYRTQKKSGDVINFKKWSVVVTDVFFRPKPWYFERDCPVCTRSASSFCRNPLYFFCTCHLGEMRIPCQVSTFSEFICSALQFQGHLAQNKSVNASNTTNYVRKGWKLTTWLWMVHNERTISLEL